MQEEIEFVRLVGNERRVGSHLADVSQNWQVSRLSPCRCFTELAGQEAMLPNDKPSR